MLKPRTFNLAHRTFPNAIVKMYIRPGNMQIYNDIKFSEIYACSFVTSLN